MRKKFFTFIIINAILFTFGAQSLTASESTVLNRRKAVEMVVQNSAALWNAKENANFGERDYQKQVLRSQGINTQKYFCSSILLPAMIFITTMIRLSKCRCGC